MPSPDPSTLSHPTLGCRILGKLLPQTIQFRNLKYASIPGRWQDSILLEKLEGGENGVYDARRHGPSCPHQRRGWRFDMGLVGEGTGLEARVEGEQGDGQVMSEGGCCQVVVTVPKEIAGSKRTEEGGLLPVFVLIHGGALSIGSNTWPQYDLEKLVNHSVKIGKPVIGVSINYRLGIFGFLACSEANITGNFGYKDQINALRWIKRHIAGFGGDPYNVTVVGESAGGISISTLLCTAKEPLFKRAITMSGEATLRKPRRLPWHNAMYQDQLQFLNLHTLSPEDRIHTLRTMPASELADRLPLAQHWCALIDDHFLPHDIPISSLASGKNPIGKPDWCEELVVGDCLHDGTVLQAKISASPSALPRLYSLSASLLSPSDRHNLLTAYHLRPSDAPSAQKTGLLELASDLRFYLPALAAAKGWKEAGKRVNRYHFRFPNPVKGEYQGLVSHELDLAFLLQNLNGVIGERGRRVAERMADLWIGFANGEGWPSEVVVFGEEVRGLGDEVYDREVRKGRGELLWGIGVERCWLLAERWQGVREEKEEKKVRAKL